MHPANTDPYRGPPESPKSVVDLTLDMPWTNNWSPAVDMHPANTECRMNSLQEKRRRRSLLNMTSSIKPSILGSVVDLCSDDDEPTPVVIFKSVSAEQERLNVQ